MGFPENTPENRNRMEGQMRLQLTDTSGDAEIWHNVV